MGVPYSRLAPNGCSAFQSSRHGAVVDAPLEAVQAEEWKAAGGRFRHSRNLHRLELLVVHHFHPADDGPVGETDDDDEFVLLVLPRLAFRRPPRSNAFTALFRRLVANGAIDYSVAMKLLERITVEPGKCGGRPCIRGMRIRVTDILGMLAEGVPDEEILRDFPYLEPDDIKAALAYAARQSDHAVLEPA